MGSFGLVPKVVPVCPALQTRWSRCWRGIPWGSGRFVCLMQWFAGRRLSVNGSNFRWFQRTSGKYWAKRFLLSASHWWLLRSLQQVTEQRRFWQPWSLLSLNYRGLSTWKRIFCCVFCSNLQTWDYSPFTLTCRICCVNAVSIHDPLVFKGYGAPSGVSRIIPPRVFIVCSHGCFLIQLQYKCVHMHSFPTI